MSDSGLVFIDEKGSWKGKDVSYWSGRWGDLRTLLPRFETRPFSVSADDPANPYLDSVVRIPRSAFERPIPVGVVSRSYTLVQHFEVGDLCVEAMSSLNLSTTDFHCELGLTELGEWMNLRIYFPRDFDYRPREGEVIALRLECFNSVEGSSRLVILLGWLRLVCTNGMIIGETKMEIRDLHNRSLNLARIGNLIRDGVALARKDVARLDAWRETEVQPDQLQIWVDGILSDSWGKKAACRVFHVCLSGQDVEITDPFAGGAASEKPVRPICFVPGALMPAGTLFDVSQALSWVATSRRNSEERVAWQAQIPALVEAIQDL